MSPVSRSSSIVNAEIFFGQKGLTGMSPVSLAGPVAAGMRKPDIRRT
jgi:hypothetical protein